MKYSCAFLFAVLFLVACGDDAVEIPDVSLIDVDFDVYRFDQSLSAIDTTDVGSGIERLRKEYGEFFDLYFKDIVPLRNETAEIFEQSVQGFLTAQSVRHLLDTTAIVYDDGTWQEVQDDFESAFTFYKYYFLDQEVPDIYAIISEYSLQRFVATVDSQDIIGVGLDMYLGAEYPYLTYHPRNPAFSQYLTRRFNKEYIVKKSMEQLVSEVIGEASGDRLLDHMIHNGKMLYILDRLLPYTSDTIIMEYTDEQWAWASDNELEMWAFFFKEDLFYKTNRIEINKYISVAPHSPGMPPSAPGRTANYLGWQIVKKYMQRYPETTLQDLAAIDDAQMILDKSRYKPRK